MADHLLEEAAEAEEDGGSQARSCVVRERGWVPLLCSAGFRSPGRGGGSPEEDLPAARRVLAPASASGHCSLIATGLLSLALFLSLASYKVLFPGAVDHLPPPTTASRASAGRPEDDLIQLSSRAGQCENYTSPWRCTHEALHHWSESERKVARECCADKMLPRVLNFDQEPGKFNARFGRCALMGSSSLLHGKRKGQEIDSHSTVIRINRLPDDEFQEDFGKKVSIIFMAQTNQMLGQVPLMKDGVLTDCAALENCEEAGMVFLQGKDDGCPLDWLKGAWPLEKHRYIGCVSNATKDLAYSFCTRTYYDGFVHLQGIPSSGFVAMLTFAPLCEELNLYGFGGRDTADGHIEWDGHPLEMEHLVERQLAGGRFWDTDVDGPSKAFYEDWKQHVKKINMM